MIRAREDRLFDRFRRTGNPRALAALFDRTAPELWRVALHLCHDRHEVEDVVQSTFLTAIEDAERWDPARPVLPWLLGILANRARSSRKRATRTAKLERHVSTPTANADPADDAAGAELRAAVHEALTEVPSPYRETLEEHLVDGRGASEIAAGRGLAAGTVRMRLHRGLGLLRHRLPRGFAVAAAVVPVDALAAMRTAVLAQAEAKSIAAGGAAMSGAGHFAVFGIGALLMQKVILGVFAGGVLAAGLLFMLSHQRGDAPAGGERPIGAPERATALVPGQVPTTLENVPRVAVEKLAAGKGSVLVRVRNQATGVGVAGIALSFYGRHIDYAKTAADGTACFTDDAGKASVILDRQERRGEAHAKRNVQLVAGQHIELVIELATKLVLDVEVVDANGRNVADAAIVGRHGDDENFAIRELGRTDAGGRWSYVCTFDGVEIRALVPGLVPSKAIYVSVERGAKQRVQLALGAAAPGMTGVVLDPDGRPAAAACVAVQLASAQPWHEQPLMTRTDGEGRFACPSVPAGACTIVAWTAAWTPWARTRDRADHAGRATHKVVTGAPNDVVVRLCRGTSVSGTVRTADGAGLADQSVNAQRMDEELNIAMNGQLSCSTMTEAAGSYAITGLVPGRYVLLVQQKEVACRQEIEVVEDGQALIWDPVLGATRTLAVEVVDEKGMPLVGWRVGYGNVPPPGTAFVGGDGGRNHKTTDRTGTVRFDDLAAQPYRLAAYGPGTTLASTVADIGPHDRQHVLHVTAASMPSARLRGSIAAEQGIALDELKVMLMDQRSSRDTPLTLDPGSGKFESPPLVPGTYDLMIMRGKEPVGGAMGIVLVPQEQRDVGTVNASPSGSMLFDVVRADGTRVDAPLIAFRREGPFHAVGNRAERTADGMLLRGLPPLAVHGEMLVWGADMLPETQSISFGPGQQRIRVVLQRGVPCTVRFTRDGQALVGGVVTVRRASGEVLVEESATLGGTGEWRRGLAPGQYDVELRTHDGAAGKTTLTVTGSACGPVDVAVR